MIHKKYVILGLLFFTIALVSLLIIDYSFSVREIKIIAEKPRKGLIAIEILKDRNLLLLSLKDAESILYDANPNLKTISLKKIYPHALEAVVTFDESLAVLEVAGGFFVLSDSGRILYKTHTNKSPLPLIHYYQKLNYSQFQAGEDVSYKDIKTALFFLKKTRDLSLPVNTIDIKGLDMIALNLTKKKILFTAEKDIKIQDYELEVVVRQLKIQGKEFEVIDLRFEKPVVKF